MIIRMKSKNGQPFYRLGRKLSPDEWTTVDVSKVARAELEQEGVVLARREGRTYDDDGNELPPKVEVSEAAIAEREKRILRRLRKSALPVMAKRGLDEKVIPGSGGGAIDVEIVQP